MTESKKDKTHALGNSSETFLVSIVTPAFNEVKNLPLLYERLSNTLNSLKIDWEWIIVDDHSSDDTFALITDLSNQDPKVRGIRFSRNFGSHTALTCGLHYANGNCAIIISADLQDPPETIPDLLSKWHEGAQVVWAVRHHREGEKTTKIGLSKLYYFIMRKVVGIKNIPSTGADFFLIDRTVIKAANQFHETNVSVLALITWMGFRQSFITYNKQARIHGKSGWSFEKKIKLLLDSITSFSYLPIRIIAFVGFLVASLGFLYAFIVIINAFLGHTPQGWTSLMVVILVLGGFQMLMMGLLGEYIWRSLDESRRRPLYLIENTTNISSHSS